MKVKTWQRVGIRIVGSIFIVLAIINLISGLYRPDGVKYEEAWFERKIQRKFILNAVIDIVVAKLLFTISKKKESEQNV